MIFFYFMRQFFFFCAGFQIINIMGQGLFVKELDRKAKKKNFKLNFAEVMIFYEI